MLPYFTEAQAHPDNFMKPQQVHKEQKEFSTPELLYLNRVPLGYANNILKSKQPSYLIKPPPKDKSRATFYQFKLTKSGKTDKFTSE